MRAHPTALGLPLLLVLGACVKVGGPPAPDPDSFGDAGAGPSLPDYRLEEPRVDQVAPTQIALGDTVQVFGNHFVPDEYGATTLVLEGTYTTEAHGEEPYQGEYALTVQNAGSAEFEFDQLYFSALQRVGTFHGSAKVVSRLERDVANATAGSERSSAWTAVSIRVLPSVDVSELRAVDTGNCAPVAKATVAAANLSFAVRAVGLGEATPEAPFTVRIGYSSPAIKARYVKEDLYQSWPPDWLTGLEDTVYVDAPDGQNTMTFVVTDGKGIHLDPTWRQTSLRAAPSVQIGQEQHSEVFLGSLQAGPVERGPGPVVANFNVEIEAADGRRVNRVVPLEIWNEFEILPYDGNQTLVRRYPAEIPSGQCGSCIPGGDIGRELSYTEGETVSRSRSISIRWDVSMANSLGLTVMVGPFTPWQIAVNAQTTWTSTFGMDVNETISTESHRSLNLTGHVLPSFYGICYRQLSEYERTVEVAYHNACGASGIVGDAIVQDWGWGFDVATGPNCVPDTNLPAPAEFR